MDKLTQAIVKAKKDIALRKQTIWLAENYLNMAANHTLTKKFYIFGNGAIVLKIPPGKTNLKTIRRIIGNGWVMVEYNTNNDGDVCRSYLRREDFEEVGDNYICRVPYLALWQDADYADGTTCKIEVIGEEIRQIKRVICN